LFASVAVPGTSGDQDSHNSYSSEEHISSVG